MKRLEHTHLSPAENAKASKEKIDPAPRKECQHQPIMQFMKLAKYGNGNSEKFFCIVLLLIIFLSMQ